VSDQTSLPFGLFGNHTSPLGDVSDEDARVLVTFFEG